MGLHNLQDKLQRGTLTDTFSGLNSPAGLRLGWGTTIGNGIEGWAPGALFFDADAAAGVRLAINGGSITSASWRYVQSSSDLVALTATVAEINAVCDDNTATAAEIVRACDLTGAVVTSTATTLSITVAQHAARLVLLNCATTCAVELPAAAGTNAKITLCVGAASTDGSKVISANGADVIRGIAICAGATGSNGLIAFGTSASSDKLTLNSTTTGGVGGDLIELWDVAANIWQCKAFLSASGAAATPFSQT